MGASKWSRDTKDAGRQTQRVYWFSRPGRRGCRPPGTNGARPCKPQPADLSCAEEDGWAGSGRVGGGNAPIQSKVLAAVLRQQDLVAHLHRCEPSAGVSQLDGTAGCEQRVAGCGVLMGMMLPSLSREPGPTARTSPSLTLDWYCTCRGSRRSGGQQAAQDGLRKTLALVPGPG